MLPFVTTGTDLEGIMLSEIRQRQMLYNVTYMWNLKQKQKQNKTKFTDTENRLVVTGRVCVGGWVVKGVKR